MKPMTVARIAIEAEITSTAEVLNSAQMDSDIPEDAPELLQELANYSVQVLKQNGFTRSAVSDPHISNLHGGYSLYLVYLLETDISVIKLILDLRVSNHTAKPNFEKSLKHREKARTSDIQKELSKRRQKDSAPTEYFDIAYQSREWGVQIFVGSGSSYSSPVDSIEKAIDIFRKKIEKLVSKYAS